MFHSEKDRGAALIISMVLMLVLLGTSAALVLVSTSQNSATVTGERNERCFAIMQAAVADSVMELNRQEDPDTDENSDEVITEAEDANIELDESTDGSTTDNVNAVGANSNWIAFGGGFYKVIATKLNNTGRFRLIVHAILNDTRRAAEVIVQATPDEFNDVTEAGDPFRNGFFQGNRDVAFFWEGSGNGVDQLRSFPPPVNTTKGNNPAKYPDFTNRRDLGFVEPSNGVFQGTVPGNMYAGGDLNINGEGFVAEGAQVRSGGDVNINSTAVDESKINKIEGQTLENPQRFDYENSSLTIPVQASDFTSNQTVNFSDGGQTVPDFNDPRHIFQLNPQNGHAGEIAETTRNDFFLSDPFAANNNGSLGHKGSGGADRETFFDGDGFEITLSPDSNNKIFFIDGNMWIHNRQTFTFRINTTGEEGTKATFVANNIFISDNVTYQNLEKDAIAMIAIKDQRDFPDEFGTNSQQPSQEGSGQVRFGDPLFGTTFRFSGFMFAEHDFFTDNVSNSLFVYGNMTAGNLVNISRNVGNSRNSLTIDFDARVQIGLDDPDDPLAISLPGLPIVDDGAAPGEEVLLQAYKAKTFSVKGLAEIAPTNTAKGVDFDDAPNQTS